MMRCGYGARTHIDMPRQIGRYTTPIVKNEAGGVVARIVFIEPVGQLASCLSFCVLVLYIAVWNACVILLVRCKYIEGKIHIGLTTSRPFLLMKILLFSISSKRVKITRLRERIL